MNIKLERWEDDEFVITLDGKPMGKTVSERDGRMVIIPWLQSALKEIRDMYEVEE